jgi:flavin-dependent dehydrogenase
MSAQRIAIVGAGPAGTALATLLVQRGAEVTLFDDGRRPDLVVGESLVPALVPISAGSARRVTPPPRSHAEARRLLRGRRPTASPQLALRAPADRIRVQRR